MWVTVLLGAAGCYALKLIGAALPSSFVENPVVKRVVLLLPVALLCALVAVQTVADKQAISVDARLPALGAAAVALHFKRSFITVVLVAAATAAALRHFGLAA